MIYIRNNLLRIKDRASLLHYVFFKCSNVLLKGGNKLLGKQMLSQKGGEVHIYLEEKETRDEKERERKKESDRGRKRE